MDHLKTIKLGFGPGKPNKQACWMTALQAHIGGEWTDQCGCVDPSINRLCITINDLYGEDDQSRTEDILEFGLFEPLGTEDEENEEKRRCFLVDRASRYWRPLKLKRLGHVIEAERLESLCPIVDEKTANAAYASVALPHAAYIACDDACSASTSAKDRRKFIKEHLFPVLRQLIDMGKHGPYEQEPVCGVEKFKQLVGVK